MLTIMKKTSPGQNKRQPAQLNMPAISIFGPLPSGFIAITRLDDHAFLPNIRDNKFRRSTLDGVSCTDSIHDVPVVIRPWANIGIRPNTQENPH